MIRNRSVRRRIRALAKDFVETAAKKDLPQMQKLMPDIASAWDKAAKTGTVHWKAAARKKSRLARAMSRTQVAGAAS